MCIFQFCMCIFQFCIAFLQFFNIALLHFVFDPLASFDLNLSSFPMESVFRAHRFPQREWARAHKMHFCNFQILHVHFLNFAVLHFCIFAFLHFCIF
jgi:hypothetical protein